jgi:hypothetical protein
MFRKTRASNGRDKASEDHGVDRWIGGGQAITRPGQRATAAAGHDQDGRRAPDGRVMAGAPRRPDGITKQGNDARRGRTTPHARLRTYGGRGGDRSTATFRELAPAGARRHFGQLGRDGVAATDASGRATSLRQLGSAGARLRYGDHGWLQQRDEVHLDVTATNAGGCPDDVTISWPKRAPRRCDNWCERARRRCHDLRRPARDGDRSRPASEDRQANGVAAEEA